ncbi:hypothetical protein BKA80DRAFT_312349 [Phyllosticta citrichinensis]
MLIANRYWDWTLDATPDTFLNSPVFDNVTGFGGNGVDIHVPGKLEGGCVKDGPFSNYTVSMGPNNSTAYNPRCMTRDIASGFASAKLNSTMVEWTLSADNYLDFDVRAEGDVSVAGMTYHAGGHKGVGGDTGIIADRPVQGPDTKFAYPFDFYGDVA